MPTKKIYGPPGTGKTRYLMELFEHELKTTKPTRVAFLTFTRAARAEALGRSGFAPEDLPFLRTIHAICYRQLGVTQGQIVKPKDLKWFGQQIGVTLSGSTQSFEGLDVGFSAQPGRGDLLMQLNHLGRHREITLNEAMVDSNIDVNLKYAKWFTLAYRDWKTKEAMLDYTDLLTEYLNHGDPLAIDVMFVDEAQDLSSLQWKVVHKLGARAQRVYVAGDDDQAIFTWAGASAELFNREPADEVEVLHRSWRVPSKVLQVANSVIHRVRDRFPKEVEPRSEGGEVQKIPYLDEAWLKDRSTFVLFRNHHRGRALKAQLEEISWPFSGDGAVLSEPRVHRALEGFQRVIDQQPINANMARAIHAYSSPLWMKPGLESQLRKDNRAWSAQELFLKPPDRSDWHSVLCKIPGRSYLGRVEHFHGYQALLQPTTHLMSIHQSKGREADTVILDLEMARKTYDSTQFKSEDEHRVWYVGVTRAKERLLTLIPEGVMYYEL